MFDGFDGWLRPEKDQPYQVSELIDHLNTLLVREFEDVLVEGEVASFKVNQGKWVFFDLKEDEATLNCFLPLRMMTAAITDGMKIKIIATPKITRWGRMSLTVKKIMPVGEGNIKKSFEILKKKLAAEGIFDPRKKRALPPIIKKIGVISSTGAAGYADFIKIVNNRWGGLEILVVNTQVQGIAAPAQIIKALDYFNQKTAVDVVTIVRGGGSVDDLAAFNDESLARAIASSKIPVVTGIGHEIDESLADLAADVRASTPSNAAEILTPDRRAVREQTRRRLGEAQRSILERAAAAHTCTLDKLSGAKQKILHSISLHETKLAETRKLLHSLNPDSVLARGYAIITSKNQIKINENIEILTKKSQILAKVLKISPKP